MIERSRELVEERYSVSNGHKYNAKVGTYVGVLYSLYASGLLQSQNGRFWVHGPVIERFT